MKSYSVLTRRVFRAIITNRPYHSATCSIRAVSATRHRSPPKNLTASQPHHRRSLFGLAIGSAREELIGAKPSAKNVETALGKLSDYMDAKRSRSRPPSNEQLVDALRFLISARKEADRGLTRNEVFLATETLQYLLRESGLSDENVPKTLGTSDLLNLLDVLSRRESNHVVYRTDVQELAKVAYDELTRYTAIELNGKSSGDAQGLYISVLANSGAAQQALTLLEESRSLSSLVWSEVLRGLVIEGRSEQVWQILNAVRFDTAALVFSNLTRQFSEKDEPVNADRVLQLASSRKVAVEPSTMAAFLQSCIRSKQWALGVPAMTELETQTSTVGVPGTLLTWHAAQGSPLATVEKLIQGLLHDGVELGMTEMNRLVRYAYSQQDPNLADMYIQLAQSVGAIPDAETYALKLDYEVSIGDISAARETFEGLCIQDVPEERFDVPVLNKYIAKLATIPDNDFQLITRVVDRLTNTDGDLEAETLAALSSAFLRRDEFHEAVALLRYRIDGFSGSDRAKIATIFKAFITDLTIKDQKAFNAYELFRHAFPETEPSERLPIMQSFFDRNRSDLACLVFGHMRQRQEIEARPNDEAYAQCFYGIAKCRDVDGLQMIYNMLKMDIHVEQTTKVHNAMMAAYTSCQTPFTAIIDHYWKILDSREGPTLSTFKLALRACEAWIGAGGEEARRIMALMQKWDLIITKDIYECYIGALAGQSQFENTIELIDCMEEDIGVAPDALTIGTFYNAIPWQYRKDEVEAWAKREYPALWEELLSYGDEIDEEWDVRYFNINRDIDVDDDLLFGTGAYTPSLAERAKLRLTEPSNREPKPALYD